jgi:O-antigen/teichoic acid export membrane protein
VGGGLGLAFNLLLARTLGAGGVGLYFIALSAANMAVGQGFMGLRNSLLRFIAANASVGDWTAVQGVYGKVMKIALSVSVLLTTLLFLAAPWVSAVVFHKPELAGPLKWMCPSIPPMTFLGLQGESLKGLKRIRDWILVSGVSLEFFSLIGLALVGNQWGVEGASGVYGSAAFLSAAIGFWLWRRATPQLKGTIGRFDTSELLQSSLPLFWTNILDTVTARVSILLLGIWVSKADVGVFGMAVRVATVVSLILVAVNSISAPKFAALYRKKEIQALSLLSRQTAKLMTFLAAPILGFFVLFPGFFMAFFGPSFRSGAPILAFLALGQFIGVVTGSVTYLLMMSGHEKVLRNRSLFMSAWTLALNLLLIPRWGILGAALSTVVSLATTNLIALVMVRRKLGFWTLPFIPGRRPNG